MPRSFSPKLLGIFAAFLVVWVFVVIYWTHAHDELMWLESSYEHDGMAGVAASALAGTEAMVNALIIGAASGRISDAVEHMGERGKNEVPINLNIPAASLNQKPTSVSGGELLPMTDDKLHVIYSTDCSDYQNWQSIALFYSALLVGQTGIISRIASGCSAEEQELLVQTYSKLFREHFRQGTGPPGQDDLTFRVHFTPDFKHDAKTGKKYAFYNKPRGLKHWLDHAVPPIPGEEVVALLDPDMIFLRPLTAEVAAAENKLYNHKLYVEKKTGKVLKTMQDRVKTGHPVAQRYGLGAPWTDDNHKKFNRTYICGTGSPCLSATQFEGEEYYSVGPPYIATRSDFDRIGTSWVDMVPRVHEGYPFLLAEMYAYSMAAAHEKLPHAIFYQYMVSNAEGGGEGWDFIDDLDDVCQPPAAPLQAKNPVHESTKIAVEHFFEGKPMPILFHYCQHFRISENLAFYKGEHRATFMTCDAHKFPACEPGGLGMGIDYKKHKRGTDIYRSERKKKRGGFAVNVIHTVLNRALTFYQSRMC